MQQTPLYQKHLEANAKMVDFAGWDMPMHYGSQIAEHNAVREDCGMFDVSHMQVIDISGDNTSDFLRYLLTGDVQNIHNNKALYSLMLNSNGGVIDDLIVYKLDKNNYRLVVNSATSAKDIEWIQKHNEDFACNIRVGDDLAIIAVAGPNAKQKVWEAIYGTQDWTQDLKYFEFASVGALFIATTGYTGESGFEIILPQKAAEFTWQMLKDAGVKPCGLGARDTLRLEAGMALYGNEMDEKIIPDEAHLNWVVDVKDGTRDFIGKSALKTTENTIKGLILESKGILRAGQIVKTNCGDGAITSGGFAPTMQKSIALARIPKNATTCQVDIRGKLLDANIVKPPFVRNNTILV